MSQHGLLRFNPIIGEQFMPQLSKLCVWAICWQAWSLCKDSWHLLAATSATSAPGIGLRHRELQPTHCLLVLRAWILFSFGLARLQAGVRFGWRHLQDMFQTNLSISWLGIGRRDAAGRDPVRCAILSKNRSCGARIVSLCLTERPGRQPK